MVQAIYVGTINSFVYSFCSVYGHIIFNLCKFWFEFSEFLFFEGICNCVSVYGKLAEKKKRESSKNKNKAKL